MVDAETIANLVGELDLASDDVTSYFHPETGEIFTAPDDDLDGDELENDEIEDRSDWLVLPGKFEIHEWAIMRESAISFNDSNRDLRESLLNAIHGSGGVSML